MSAAPLNRALSFKVPACASASEPCEACSCGKATRSGSVCPTPPFLVSSRFSSSSSSLPSSPRHLVLISSRSFHLKATDCSTRDTPCSSDCTCDRFQSDKVAEYVSLYLHFQSNGKPSKGRVREDPGLTSFSSLFSCSSEIHLVPFRRSSLRGMLVWPCSSLNEDVATTTEEMGDVPSLDVFCFSVAPFSYDLYASPFFELYP
ncbi:hypothetical protein BDY24DRAFT_90635 [Mrakia frigida]|uniref:uncharacterized protein n=1 Tax=Mrakia frigida TaxID=29902 RepID=UPI003FCC1BFF